MRETLVAFDEKTSMREKDSNGYLRVKLTPISKAAVNPYLGREIPGWEELGLDPEAIYYGLRDPEELKKAAASFNGLPILNKHLPESAENPNKENRVGSTGTDAVYDHPYLKNSLSITDAVAIKSIEDGTCKEISGGYKYSPDFSAPGKYEGIDYDFVMRDLEGNHIALVPDGRAGPDVVVVDSMPDLIKERTENMRKGNPKATKSTLIKKIYALDEAIQKDQDIDPEVKEKAADLVEIAEEIKTENKPALDNDIDFNMPVEDIIKANAPGLEGEAFDFVKKLIIKLQEAVPAEDNLPPEKNMASDAISNETLEKIAEALKSIPSDELWDSFRGLTDVVNKKRSSDLIDKLLQVIGNGAATDDNEEIEKKKEPAPMAADANTIRREVEKNLTAKVRALNAAAQNCHFILGNNIDALAFDSAEAIYAMALDQAGIEYKQYPKSAYQAMIDMHRRTQGEAGFAFDAQPFEDDDEVDDILKGLDHIKIG